MVGAEPAAPGARRHALCAAAAEEVGRLMAMVAVLDPGAADVHVPLMLLATRRAEIRRTQERPGRA